MPEHPSSTPSGPEPPLQAGSAARPRQAAPQQAAATPRRLCVRRRSVLALSGRRAAPPLTWPRKALGPRLCAPRPGPCPCPRRRRRRRRRLGGHAELSGSDPAAPRESPPPSPLCRTAGETRPGCPLPARRRRWLSLRSGSQAARRPSLPRPLLGSAPQAPPAPETPRAARRLSLRGPPQRRMRATRRAGAPRRRSRARARAGQRSSPTPPGSAGTATASACELVVTTRGAAKR